MIWYQYPTFVGIAGGYFFYALAYSLVSGTLQAYLYDMLMAYNKVHLFELIWGKGITCNGLGFAFGWILGGIGSEYSYNLVLAASVLSGLLATLVALFLPNVARHYRTDEPNVLKFLHATVGYAFSHPLILNAFLFTAVVRSSYIVIDEYWSVYFAWLGIPNAVFGILMSVATALGGCASLLAYRFKDYGWKAIHILGIFTGVVLILAGFLKCWLILVCMLSLEMIICVTGILVDGIIQRNVTASQRTTVASVNSLLQESALITGLVFGYLVDGLDISRGYVFLGSFVLLFFFVEYVVQKLGSILKKSD